MEAKFAVRAQLDMPACRALARVTQKKGIILATLLMLPAAAALFLLAAAKRSFAAGVGGAFFAVCAAYYAFFLEKKVARVTLRAGEGRPGAHMLRFGAGGVETEDGLTAYGDFTRFALCRGYYLLFTRRRTAYVFPSGGFAEGDAGDFPAYIAEKTRLRLERIR